MSDQNASGSDTGPSTSPVADLTKPPPPPAGAPSSEERTMAMLMYLLAILTGWLAPLIIWLLKKDQSAFINDQGKELLNFQITVFIAVVVCLLLTFVIIGCFLAPVVVIGNVVFSILGAVAVNKGEAYRFPFNIRLIK